MAFSRTAKAATAGETTTLDTTSFSVGAGNLLVVCVASKHSVTASLRKASDSSIIQSFTEATSVANGFAVRTTILYLPDTIDPGENVFVRVLQGGGAAIAATVSEVSGAGTSSPLDKTNTNIGYSTSPSSGSTATTEEADEILFGAVGTDTNVFDSAGSWLNSFTDGQRVGSGVTVSEGFRIVSAAGAYAAEKAGISLANWAAAIATFKGHALPIPNKSRVLSPLLAM